MSSYTLNGKYAIVTGAGSGIGHAVTKLLLSSGCSVMLADLKLRPEAYQTLNDYSSTSNSVTAIFHPTDVSDWKQLTSLWETAVQSFGRVDIVASVAGIYEPPSSNFWNPPGISSLSEDSVDASVGQYKTFAVNQVAPIRLAQMAIDYWTQHRDIQGNFLVVASVSAYLHSIETPLYMASKAALVSFVKSLSGLRDLFGIRISAVCPGPVLTPIFEPGWNKKLTVDDIHLTPEECASVILRVLQESQWGNGSIVETQKIGDKETTEVVVEDIHLERLYPTKYAKPSARVIESRQNLVKRIQATGLRAHHG